MKKTMIPVFLALCASVLGASPRQEGADRPLKVLMIGNSFSFSVLSHTPAIAEAQGRRMDIASLFIGGCSFERHWSNVIASTNASFKPYRYDRMVGGRRKVNDGSINLLYALESEKWDVVTVQQVSHLSFKPETYRPYADRLVALVREKQPGAKIYFQETWSYPPWDRRLRKFGLDHIEMYVKHRTTCRAFAKEHSLEVIPVGTAVAFAPDRNSLFPSGDFHFNCHGAYLQGLVWAAKILGIDVLKTSYKPSGMDDERADELKRAASEAVSGGYGVRRAFREPFITRGSINVLRSQSADEASWVWYPGEKGFSFLKFRKEFTVEEGDGPLLFDITADERFYLTIDGKFIARGPNRSTVENWQYNTYVASLKPGRHVVEATVWTIEGYGPLAQLSYRGGFLFKAAGAYDAKLSTGKASWKVGKIGGVTPAGSDAGAWGTGSQFEIKGCGPCSAVPAEWKDAVVVRGPAGVKGPNIYGLRTGGWMLFPSQLPDQINVKKVPGRVKAVAKGAPFRSNHVYTAEEAKETIDITKPFTVPAGTKMQIAWDLEKYHCAYPEVILSGGRGARFAMCFGEASHRGDTHLKTSEPGSRAMIVGRYLPSFGDTFVSDGRKGAVFSAPWFRCGKWVRIDIETKDEPLTVDSVAIYETRYPLELKSVFSSPQDATLGDIRRISARAMQMCCHEMLFDCPFYEQQMYPGDTRVQLNVLSSMMRDDRMVKRAIEIYDLNTRDDGMCPFNYPTRNCQEGASYTLCYLLMYGDYAMNHADRAWLRARLPGMRKSMAGLEFYENGDGLLENIPGWNFVDWTVGWDSDGTAPDARVHEGVSAVLNLYWNLAMKSAAVTERALGNELQAKYWEEKSAKLSKSIVSKFWSEKRGMLADNVRKTKYSEHSQSLALLGDVLPADKAEKAWNGLITDKNLRRCTVYFSYYLFETYFKFGRGDLFLKRLDLWRDYVKKGLTTTQEAPDKGKNRQKESRSDCHAWGAHPIWFMQTGLAGIKPAAPFFREVLIEPSPGYLKEISVTHPHPDGWIKADLRFEGGRASGNIHTPVPGVFKFGGKSVSLVKGENVIK